MALFQRAVVVALATLIAPGAAFLDDILRQMHGGQGGGQRQQFNMGGGQVCCVACGALPVRPARPSLRFCFSW